MLYHGSSVRGIKILLPKAKSKRKSDDPSIVWASPEKAIATICMIPATDDWCMFGYCFGTFYLMVNNESRFWRIEKIGGSIYEVSKEGFACGGEGGFSKYELCSTEAVLVVYEEQWGSAFSAMCHYGVRVRIVNKLTFLFCKTILRICGFIPNFLLKRITC